jgi:hypothetical protein
MCKKRAAGSVKSPTGVTVWRETLERWQAWQARAQVRQSFCMSGHTKRCATSLAVALGPGCEQLVDGLEHFESKGSLDLRPKIPGKCVAVDGDRGAGNQLLLELQGGCCPQECS